MNFSNFRIGARLLAAFAAVLLWVGLMMGVGIWALDRTAEATHSMLDTTLQKERLTEVWYRMVSVGAIRNAAIATSTDPATSERFIADAKASSATINELVDQVKQLSTSAAEQALLEKVADTRQANNAARNQMMAARAQGQAAEAQRLYGLFLRVSPAYLESIEAFVNYQRHALDEAARKVDADATRSKWALTMIGLLAMVTGAALATLITRSITRPMFSAVKLADAVAQGDLTQRVQPRGRDEISGLMHSLGTMASSLHGMVSQVRLSTDSIQTASGEVATGNQDLSVRTEQTASNLQEAAAAMEQLTATVRQSSDAARQASQLASSAAEVATRSGDMVGRVVTTMEEISASSRKISDIIGTIDGIAFQTNILALNAAVEAARAGEQGRGFAVVASEVRSLAQRSADAAKEIKRLIGSSAEKVEGGSRLVADAGTTMQDLVQSVRRVADIIGEVTAAAGEQTQGITQVSASVGELDRMTQQNAALVEQSAAAAESLKTQAHQLAQAMHGFRLEA